jgi:hypothetical protein
MHTIEFNFHTITNEQAIDALVYSVSIELWLAHSIESYQTRAGQLHFNTARDQLVASIACSADPRYTITLVN